MRAAGGSTISVAGSDAVGSGRRGPGAGQGQRRQAAATKASAARLKAAVRPTQSPQATISVRAGSVMGRLLTIRARSPRRVVAITSPVLSMAEE